MFNQQNTFNAKVIVKRVIIRVATAGGTASSVGDIGVATSTATLSDTLIDGIDLNAASGRDDHVISIPATYVIDQSGQIVFANANRDYKIRPSPDEILEALKSLTK